MNHLLKLCLTLGLVASLHTISQAQTLPFALTGGSGSTAVDFEFRLDGTIIEKGGGTSTLTTSDLSANPLFLWYGSKAALRVGGTFPETPSSIGGGSMALGYNCQASGSEGIAAGADDSASGASAIALGSLNSAAYNSVAIGASNSSTGAWTCTLGGYGNTSTASFSTAMGGATLASGVGATSTGWASVASGEYSASFNNSTASQSLDSAAFGAYNVGGGNATSWVATDPLFEIGNGTSSSARTDALVVYKNGNVVAQGIITAAHGGDIPMYTGN